jgi:hypothetical protein
MFFGWKRDYTDLILPVINTPIKIGDNDFIANSKSNIYFTIFLDKIYSLSNIRGINIYKFAYNRKGNHSNILIDEGVTVFFLYPPVDSVEDTPSEWYRRNGKVIAELVSKYPRLFVMSGGLRFLSKTRRVFRDSRKRSTKKYIKRLRR